MATGYSSRVRNDSSRGFFENNTRLISKSFFLQQQIYIFFNLDFEGTGTLV